MKHTSPIYRWLRIKFLRGETPYASIHKLKKRGKKKVAGRPTQKTAALPYEFHKIMPSGNAKRRAIYLNNKEIPPYHREEALHPNLALTIENQIILLVYAYMEKETIMVVRRSQKTREASAMCYSSIGS